MTAGSDVEMCANMFIAYGDMNLFCTCAPVEDSEDITGAAAPMPT